MIPNDATHYRTLSNGEKAYYQVENNQITAIWINTPLTGAGWCSASSSIPASSRLIPVEKKKSVDGHYKHSFKGIKLDPYRICRVYNIGGGPREHMLKKLLRGSEKGHTEEDLIAELESSLNRWKAMLKEEQDDTTN